MKLRQARWTAAPFRQAKPDSNENTLSYLRQDQENEILYWHNLGRLSSQDLIDMASEANTPSLSFSDEDE
jgi:hypothetical protein